MKAVVWHGVGDIRLDNVKDPSVREPTDAIVRLTASAICGTDLHFVRGSAGGMKAGTILGHEGVGVVEAVGKGVRNFKPGDRVVIPSTIACGACGYCRAGYFGQCDVSNPNGPEAGTSFYGGPAESGPFNGLQAEFARVPFAHVGMVAVPAEVSDEQAITVSDIFPTAYFGADIAEIRPGDTVAVFGCGPVGQFAIASAKMLGASRIIAVDREESRLNMARAQGAEVVNFDVDDHVAAIKALTRGHGADRAIDAVGVDAVRADGGPAAAEGQKNRAEFDRELAQNAPKTNPQGLNWVPGNAPSQAVMWAVQALAKCGRLSIIGVYPQTHNAFPLGAMMNKNISVASGNCHHRKYVPRLLDLVRAGHIDPRKVLTEQEPLTNVIDAYKAFDLRQPGWIKVELKPAAA